MMLLNMGLQLFDMLLILMLLLIPCLIISVILNGNISFLFIDVEIKLLFLNLFVCMIQISNLILVVVQRYKIVPLELALHTGAIIVLNHLCWSVDDLIFHNSQQGRVYFSAMYLGTRHFF